MRIHRLEVTAFGPFSGSETVDFDALTDAGLFLLCGPTGAGKTSVLDAVCFGLYGEVPGDRNAAKRLRSDHAAPGVAPIVALEVTLAGRRFRIRRSPAWQRPKRRGTGFTTENAKVTLEELLDGTWVHLSSRLDETGHQVTELLGMNVSQFTQVAMLPQGRFQSFLRAKSDERHKVLQRLFRTSRFEDIERWLVQRRQALRAENQTHQEAVASVVSRLCEASSSDLPADWELHELAAPAEDGTLADWSAGILAKSVAERDTGELELVTATATARSARDRLAEARATTELRARHAEALRARQALERTTAEEQDARRRLADARRAAAVAPLLRVADEAADAARVSREQLATVLADAADRLGRSADEVTSDELAAAERRAHDTASVARALLPREAELQNARRTLEHAEARITALSEESTGLEVQLEELPDRLRVLREALTARLTLAATADTAAERERDLAGRLEGARRAVILAGELAAARERLHERVDAAQALRQRMHDLREARISGMAAELAASLASGGCCPVCGSAEHPSVAAPVDGAPTQADEDAARSAYEDADFARQAQAEAVSSLEHNLALAGQAAGGRSVDDLTAELEEARQHRAYCIAAREEAERLTGEIDDVEEVLARLRARANELTTELTALRQERDHATELVDKVTAELAELFADEDVADSVGRLIELQSAAGAAFSAAREAFAQADRSASRAAEAAAQADACAHEHGFDSTARVRDAALPAETTEALERLVAEREQLRARIDTILSDPEVETAVAAAAPDLEDLESQAVAAEEAHAAAGAHARVLSVRSQRLGALDAELTRHLEAWAPTRAAYAVAHTMSTFAEGKGGDNTLQMRLSAYVLAERLRQVVAAANERLGRMTGERYRLEHSASRGAGDQRGGLGLLVRDEWTGETRDPATLSGGETFVTSLALALGLADVVTREAGGADIDTLFIDEGFGSLDPETLDDVMDTLDGLRDGGRVVGIVSHVPEMRTRIPAQLQIRKDRTGSRILAQREPV